MDLLQMIQIECGYFSEMVTLGKSLINDFKSGGMASPDIDLTTSEGITTLLNQGDDLINFVSDALDCFELDRFQVNI